MTNLPEDSIFERLPITQGTGIAFIAPGFAFTRGLLWVIAIWVIWAWELLPRRDLGLIALLLMVPILLYTYVMVAMMFRRITLEVGPDRIVLTRQVGLFGKRWEMATTDVSEVVIDRGSGRAHAEDASLTIVGKSGSKLEFPETSTPEDMTWLQNEIERLLGKTLGTPVPETGDDR